jgi:hypothetical protein
MSALYEFRIRDKDGNNGYLTMDIDEDNELDLDNIKTIERNTTGLEMDKEVYEVIEVLRVYK